MTWAVELGRGGLNGTYPEYGWWQAAGLVVLAGLAFFWAVRVDPGLPALGLTAPRSLSEDAQRRDETP